MPQPSYFIHIQEIVSEIRPSKFKQVLKAPELQGYKSIAGITPVAYMLHWTALSRLI